MNLKNNINESMGEDSAPVRGVIGYAAKKSIQANLKNKAAGSVASRAGRQFLSAKGSALALGASAAKTAIITFVTIYFICLLFKSFASCAYNEVFDIDHYARDDKIKEASCTKDGQTTAQTEDDVVAGFQVIRQNTMEVTGAETSDSVSYSATSTSTKTKKTSSSSNSDNAIIQIAQNEVGYIPDTPGYAKYQEEVGYSGYNEWCGIFCAWVYTQAGLEDKIPSGFGMAHGWLGAGTAHRFDDGYTPQAGDIITFDYNDNNFADHVGIVKSVDDNYIYTIEGNTSMPDSSAYGVAEKTRAKDSDIYYIMDMDSDGGVVPVATTASTSNADSEYDSVWATVVLDVSKGNYEDLMDGDVSILEYAKLLVCAWYESLDDDQWFKKHSKPVVSVMEKIAGLFSSVGDWIEDKYDEARLKYKENKANTKGYKIAIYEEQVQEVEYTVYKKKVIDGQTYYVAKKHPAKTKKTITVDNYQYVGRSEKGEALYIKQGTRTITPKTEYVKVDKEKVKGFGKKAVYMKSLGLEPNEIYRDGGSMTNLEYADYLYDFLVNTLDIPVSSGGYTGGYDGIFIWPLARFTTAEERAHSITSLMMVRESPGGVGSTNHQGLDIMANYNEEIITVAAGTVIQSGPNGGYGNSITIDCGQYNGQQMTVLYGHNTSLTKNVGDTVSQGDVIAYAGSTGNSTGPHCHLEVRLDGEAVDPLEFYTKSYVYGYTSDDDHPNIIAEGLAAEKTPANVSNDDFDLICAIIRAEALPTYESALGVMSCAMNRVNSSGYPDDILSVLEAPWQFVVYQEGLYKKYLNGNYEDCIKEAVTDALNGKTNHNYLEYRSYETSGSVCIGGNYYFGAMS